MSRVLVMRTRVALAATTTSLLCLMTGPAAARPLPRFWSQPSQTPAALPGDAPPKVPPAPPAAPPGPTPAEEAAGDPPLPAKPSGKGKARPGPLRPGRGPRPLRGGKCTAQEKKNLERAYQALDEAQEHRAEGRLQKAIERAEQAATLSNGTCKSEDAEEAASIRERATTIRSRIQVAERKACEGQSACFVAGVSAAAMHVVGLAGPRDGRASALSFSVLVPQFGGRFLLGPSANLDLVVYAPLITTDFEQTNFSKEPRPCGRSNSAFEAGLPCEADALVFPLAGGAMLLDFGSSIVPVAPALTMGVARTSQEPTVGFYGGVMLTVASFYLPVGVSR